MSILLQVLYHGAAGTDLYVVDAPKKNYFDFNQGSDAFFVAYARVTLKDGIVTRMTGYSMQRNVWMPQVLSSIKIRSIVKNAVIGEDWLNDL
jgi:hypothetical protein